MAVAGIDILKLVQGAEKARKEFDLRSFENPLWLYAGGRNALLRRGRRIELFGSTAPEVRALARWWQQLSAQEETSGIFPVLAEYPRTIRCLGKRIADGGDVFETLVRFVWEEPPYTIGSDVCDLDGLNDLAGKTLEEIQDQAFQSVLAEHSDAGVPVITMACGQLGAGTLGELFGFLELASGLSGCISNQSFREP